MPPQTQGGKCQKNKPLRRIQQGAPRKPQTIGLIIHICAVIRTIHREIRRLSHKTACVLSGKLYICKQLRMSAAQVISERIRLNYLSSDAIYNIAYSNNVRKKPNCYTLHAIEKCKHTSVHCNHLASRNKCLGKNALAACGTSVLAMNIDVPNCLLQTFKCAVIF